MDKEKFVRIWEKKANEICPKEWAKIKLGTLFIGTTKYDVIPVGYIDKIQEVSMETCKEYLEDTQKEEYEK